MRIDEKKKEIQKLRTYLSNNLTVIKDNGLFKVLFKLLSLQMKEYNKALKKQLPTDNITFQYSLNEFRLDLQMGKATILRKFEILSSVGLLSTTTTKDKKNAYNKNIYQLNINLLDEITLKLNKMRRKERIEYINSIFDVKTSQAILSIKEDKIDEELVEDIIEDIIEEQPTEETITNKQYIMQLKNVDKLTQYDSSLYNTLNTFIENRRFTLEQLQQWIDDKIEFFSSQIEEQPTEEEIIEDDKISDEDIEYLKSNGAETRLQEILLCKDYNDQDRAEYINNLLDVVKASIAPTISYL